MAKRLIPGKTNKDKGKILSHRRPKVDLNVLKGTRYEHLIKCLEAREEENKRKRRAKKNKSVNHAELTQTLLATQNVHSLGA